MTCFILGIKRWIRLQVEARLKMANMNRQCMTVGIIRSCRNWNSWWAEAYAWPWETDLEAKLARCYNDLVGTDELGRGKLRRLLSFPVPSLLWGNVWEVQIWKARLGHRVWVCWWSSQCRGLLIKPRRDFLCLEQTTYGKRAERHGQTALHFRYPMSG